MSLKYVLILMDPITRQRYEDILTKVNTTNPWASVYDHWGCRYYRGNYQLLYDTFEVSRCKWESENLVYTPNGVKRVCHFCGNTVHHWRQHESTVKHRNSVLPIFKDHPLNLDVEREILSYLFVTIRIKKKVRKISKLIYE